MISLFPRICRILGDAKWEMSYSHQARFAPGGVLTAVDGGLISNYSFHLYDYVGDNP